MKVLITGAAGFLGQLLAQQLLATGHLIGPDGAPQTIDELLLVDIAPAQDFGDPRVRIVTGDISESALLSGLIDADTASVFHLAAIVSSQAEAEFDLGLRINLDASRLLLDSCRRVGHRPRVVFTSSVAVYGGTLPALVNDGTALNPQSSYGTQKAIAELLLTDYSRRGFIDGRVLRLPTISVRPGKPNKAASSFASGIVREPLNGEDSICPVSADTRLWLMSPQKAIDALIAGHELPGDALGQQRAINLPGVCVSVGEMLDALKQIAGAEVAARVAFQPDPEIQRIISSWPCQWDSARAEALGIRGDADAVALIQAFQDSTR